MNDMNQTRDDLPPDDTWTEVADDGFIGLVGPMWSKPMGNGDEIVGFRAGDKHKNLNGVVQGGMLMTLADRGMGRCVRRANGGHPVTTVHFSYDFIAGGRLGSFIELHPKITKETGSLAFMESVLICEGEIVGRANGVWKKFKPRK